MKARKGKTAKSDVLAWQRFKGTYLIAKNQAITDNPAEQLGDPREAQILFCVYLRKIVADGVDMLARAGVRTGCRYDPASMHAIRSALYELERAFHDGRCIAEMPPAPPGPLAI